MDKIKCDFFHETDGECCEGQKSCCLWASIGVVDPREQTPSPVHEPLDIRGFFVILGFAAVCYVFDLFILAQYQPRSTTYLAPLARIVP